MNNQNNNNNPVLDAVAIFSFYIAIKNLQENSQQTEMLRQKLDDQNDKYLERAIRLLEESIEQNNILLEKLEKVLNKITE